LTTLLLDTHALVWLVQGNRRLGARSRAIADEALAVDRISVSAISFWEIAMLAVRGRLNLDRPPSIWREEILGMGVVEIPICGAIGIRAAELQSFHPDPADRTIVSTAIHHGASLLTADRLILGWGGLLNRFNASL